MHVLVTGIGQCSLDSLALIDKYPAPDTKTEAYEWIEQGGGPVATALVTLSRLGVATRFAGVVGDDDAGRTILQSLLEENVDTTYLVERERTASQHAFIAVERGTAARTIFWKRPTGAALKPDEIDDAFFRGSRFLLLDGLMPEVSHSAVERAKRLRIPIMVDAGRMREGMLDLCAASDYVVGSEEFARELGWQGDHEAFFSRVRELNWNTTTITLGSRGSVTYHGFRMIRTPAFRVDAVDSTGAGDVFHGAFLAGILSEWELELALFFASAAAALKCRQLGGRTAIPDFPAVARFMADHGLPLP